MELERRIIAIRVFKTWESCERTTFYVELMSDEGYTMTPASFATGSVYTNHEGLSIEEARDRALMTAHEWGDFLCLPVDPYVDENDVQIEPSMLLNTYSTRRELKRRREAGKR